MQSLNNLSAMLNRDNLTIKTGIVQHYVNGFVDVAIDGALVNLAVVDSVTLSLGQTVLCAVNGANGYVIGSLNGTTRAESAWYELGYGNPQAPDYKTLDTYVTDFTPIQVGFYDTASYGTKADITGSADPYSFTVGGANKYVLWYYGANAFAALTGASISKVEFRMRVTAIGAGTQVLGSHTDTAFTLTAPTFTAFSYNVTTMADTWVDITSLFTMDDSDRGFAVRTTAGANSYTSYVQPGFGTVRVTYTK